MIKHTDNGRKDVKDTATVPGISSAAQEIAMLLSLQKREWQELRSVNGVVLKYINLQEPTTNHRVLLIAIGTCDDDILGNDATLDVFINGLGIDAIVERVAQKKMAEKE